MDPHDLAHPLRTGFDASNRQGLGHDFPVAPQTGRRRLNLGRATHAPDQGLEEIPQPSGIGTNTQPLPQPASIHVLHSHQFIQRMVQVIVPGARRQRLDDLQIMCEARVAGPANQQRQEPGSKRQGLAEYLARKSVRLAPIPSAKRFPQIRVLHPFFHKSPEPR
jgi:hypothetical protein